MDIKKYIKKINKVSTFTVLATGFIVGLVVMYLYIQPKLTNQIKKTNDWQNTANQNQTEIISYKAELASASAQLKTLQDKPTPTPIIKYITKYQTITEEIPAKPKQQGSVYYNSYGGSLLYGSDGSTCDTYTGTLHCSK